MYVDRVFVSHSIRVMNVDVCWIGGIPSDNSNTYQPAMYIAISETGIGIFVLHVHADVKAL